MRAFLQKLPQATALHVLLIFVALLVPLLMTSNALQIDEVDHWQFRVYYFISAMSYGNFGDTAQTEHPGVTTVMLSSLAHLYWKHVLGNFQLPMPEYMHILRLPIKVMNALVISLAYIPLRRVFGWRIALLGVVLFIAEPFARWYMRLLHIDGLNIVFMTLSFGLMLLSFRTLYDSQPERPIHWWALVLSGIAAGLAALTRFSAIYLFGMVGICALLNAWPYRRDFTMQRFWRWLALPVAVFTGVLVITWIAGYPAMWTNPQAVWEETVHGVDNATTPHHLNFYMGEARRDPGPTFYPVVLLFRLTPWVFAGLFLAAVAAWRGALKERTRLWLAVALYAAIYALLLTIQAKKFDRYLLVTFPALALLASVGWLWLTGVIGRRFNLRAMWGNVAYVAALVAVLASAQVYVTREYAYANPLAGGGRFVDDVLLMNSGEGLEGLEIFFAQLPEDERCNVTFMIPYLDLSRQYIECSSDFDAKYIRDATIDKNIDYIARTDYIVNQVSWTQMEPQRKLA
ncbi:MAG: glycosyltransferase family 39 protein, partial [Chloroflexota bacterium]